MFTLFLPGGSYKSPYILAKSRLDLSYYDITIQPPVGWMCKWLPFVYQWLLNNIPCWWRQLV